MQQALIALALVGTASAGHLMPEVYGGFSYSRHTWCGPYGGTAGYMIDTLQECQHAAAVLGKPFVGQAGQEWFSGCIVHNDHAYFVKYDAEHAKNGKHHQSSNKGFLCMNDDADKYGSFEMRDVCASGYKIKTEQDCANAARGMSFNRVGNAGSDDWEDGCIVNHREAYWVPSSGLIDKAPHKHNGGSICFMAPGEVAADGSDDSSDGVPEETAPEEATPPIIPEPEPEPTPETQPPTTTDPPTDPPATPAPTSIFAHCHTKEYVYGEGVRWAKKDCNDFADRAIYNIDNDKHIIRKKKNFCKTSSRFFKKCPRSCCYYKAQDYVADYVKISKEDNKAER